MSYPGIISIINPNTLTHIDPVTIFGKDANRLLKACDKVFHNWLPNGKYEGCYRSPSRPTLDEISKTIDTSTGDNIATTCKAAIATWEVENPEEAEKEKRSRQEWEAQRDKQFRIIYGIALRHNLYMHWHGKDGSACCGDQWSIYRHGKFIGRICCL